VPQKNRKRKAQGKIMTRIVIIGGSGHVGTYFVPALVARGHNVVNVSRGTAAPYRPHPSWKAIEQVVVDREAEEAGGGSGLSLRGFDSFVQRLILEIRLEEFYRRR
jgi:nucleoside-diphosphate-sugar epimerase